MDALDRLTAHEEIRQLAAHYAVALDSRDLDALVGLFVDDVQVGRDGRGRDALREAFTASLAGVGVSILNVGTHAIDIVDDDHAIGAVYCKGEIQDRTDGRWVHQAILYRDTYERRDGRWLFARREHELWYGVHAWTDPLAQPPAEWPKHAIGRGTLPESWESWRRAQEAGGT